MSRRTSLVVGGAIAAALALGGLVGGVLAESHGSAQATAAPTALADRALTGAAASLGASATRTLEDRVRARAPRCRRAHRARVRVPAALARDRGRLVPPSVRGGAPPCACGSGRTMRTRCSVSARSRSSATSSATALRYGRRAERLLPGSYRPYGVTGDALVELGRYDEAFAAFDRMISLRPSLASYARVAYARELVGDRRGARAAMQLALTSAAGQPEPTAWAHVELSKLERALGRLDSARRHTTAALRALPGYPSARVELAQVDAADGDLRGAIRAARPGRRGDADRTGRRAARRPARARGPPRCGPPTASHGRGDRPTAGCERRAGRSRDRRRIARTTRSRPDGDGGAAPGAHVPLDRPSTATMRSVGRSPVQVAAARQSRGSTARSGWVRATPSCTSTAATRNAARAIVAGGRAWFDASARPERGVLRALGAGRPGAPLRLERPPRGRIIRDVNRTRAWLVVSPVIAAGVLVAHALAYRLTSTPTDPFHEYLAHAPQVLLLLALSGLAIAGFGPRRDAPPAWVFPTRRRCDVRRPGARRADRARRRRSDPRHDARVPRRPGAATPGCARRLVPRASAARAPSSVRGHASRCGRGSSSCFFRSSSITSRRSRSRRAQSRGPPVSVRPR